VVLGVCRPVFQEFQTTGSFEGVQKKSMKSTFTRTAIVLAALLSISAFAQTQTASSAAPGGGAAATTNPAPTGPVPTKIGLIGMRDVILSINDGKRQFDTLNRKYEAKDAELRKSATELQTLQESLKNQGPKMNEEARNALIKQIDQKQRALQANSDAAKADYQSDLNDVVNSILKKLGPVVEKYAKDNGYAVIFDVNPLDGNQQVSPVLWGADTANITQTIIDAYNAQAGSAPAPSSSAPKPPATRPSGTGTTGTTTPHTTTTPPKPPANPKPQQ
jgi:outer membrane protein